MKVYIIGIGMGNRNGLTLEAEKAVMGAEVILGAERMTDPFKKDKKVINCYLADDVAGTLSGLSDVSVAAVLLSGDVGFYSGAKKLYEVLSGYEVIVLPGISSVVYMCAKLQKSWEDVKLLSLHGRECNYIGNLLKYGKVFLLLSGKKDLENVMEKLSYYGLYDTEVYVGSRLSYDDENIVKLPFSNNNMSVDETVSESVSFGKADPFFSPGYDFDRLSVLYMEYPFFSDNSLKPIPDDGFIRGKVPMTKEEVRCLSLSKLYLKPDSVLYDIGAGTGSVSIEAGRKMTDGRVFAIEKKEEAVFLIKENIRKFKTDNVSVVLGEAPLALEKLPAPTHVFVGGSGKNMEKIIDCVMEKNTNARIVVNVIALNSLTEVINMAEDKGYGTEVLCVNISKSKTAGDYQLMMALNPVYIIVLERKQYPGR